ncbi:MAG TPA: adenylyl-sulfate kinase [Vicinamibacterales bacterium]
MTRLPDELARLPARDLPPAQFAVLELLLSGALAPVRGYMTRREIAHVSATGRLPDGTPWLLPLTLGVPPAVGAGLREGDRLVLRDFEGVPRALVTVRDIWSDPGDGDDRLGGEVEPLGVPSHAEFAAWRRTPSEIAEAIAQEGWQQAVAVMVPAAMPVALLERAREAAGPDGGVLLLGVTPSASLDDRRRFAIMRGFDVVRRTLPRARLVLLPSLPEATGAARLLLLATIARQYGATHLLVDPREAVATQQALPDGTIIEAALEEHGPALVTIDGARGLPAAVEPVSGWLGDTVVLHRIEAGLPLPPGFVVPGVEAMLRAAVPPPDQRGVTVFFTGLSGSGKSTIANRLRSWLLEHTSRTVTLLDGDLVRRHLSSELGFSREHRTLNIERIAFVAAEIARHGGLAICAPIAPYAETRRTARRMIEAAGGFVLVYVDTPLEVCEARDRKGLYARARAGLIQEFTGISDPYEPPDDADLVIRTESCTPDEAVRQVVELLKARGYLKSEV